MTSKDIVLVRVDKGKIKPMSLAEWAARFNEQHRLPSKEAK